MPEGVILITQGFACDRLDQAKTVATAGAESFEAGQAKAKELNTTLNDLGELPCGVMSLAGKVVANTPMEKPVPLQDGNLYNVWVQEVENVAKTPTHLTYFLLHFERTDGAVTPSSVPPKGIDEEGRRYIVFRPPSL